MRSSCRVRSENCQRAAVSAADEKGRAFRMSALVGGKEARLEEDGEDEQVPSIHHQ